MFKECLHPDDKQRLKLSQELGLKPRQVKFWFHYRCTQMKAQHDRADNVLLRDENESLNADNFCLQATIRNVVCPNYRHAAVLVLGDRLRAAPDGRRAHDGGQGNSITTGNLAVCLH
jgi:hypothetical protein